jgi:hypothetical protein
MTDQNQLGAEEMNFIGDLFPGFAFGGDTLYCPLCGDVMENNASFNEWFRCVPCKIAFHVLKKLPSNHPVFQEEE